MSYKCPSCLVRPGDYHTDECEQAASGSTWLGPSDTPGMVLIELTPGDTRLMAPGCMKCSLPLLDRRGEPPEDWQNQQVFLTREGRAIHVRCVLDLAEAITGPLRAISEEYEARRRALLGQ